MVQVVLYKITLPCMLLKLLVKVCIRLSVPYIYLPELDSGSSSEPGLQDFYSPRVGCYTVVRHWFNYHFALDLLAMAVIKTHC